MEKAGVLINFVWRGYLFGNIIVQNKVAKNNIPEITRSYSVCNFQSLKSLVELNSLFLKFFYIT